MVINMLLLLLAVTTCTASVWGVSVTYSSSNCYPGTEQYAVAHKVPHAPTIPFKCAPSPGGISQSHHSSADAPSFENLIQTLSFESPGGSNCTSADLNSISAVPNGDCNTPFDGVQLSNHVTCICDQGLTMAFQSRNCTGEVTFRSGWKSDQCSGGIITKCPSANTAVMGRVCLGAKGRAMHVFPESVPYWKSEGYSMCRK